MYQNPVMLTQRMECMVIVAHWKWEILESHFIRSANWKSLKVAGYFDGDDKLVICYNRPIDYNFYDIKDNFNFTWKTVALKGIIKNSIILDMVLYDFNHDVIWIFSSICKVEKLSNESDNYQYDNYELWRIKYEENDKTCIVEIIKNGDSHQGNESTIKSINFHIKRNLVNQWFATNYTA